jgi:hypothetical protein
VLTGGCRVTGRPSTQELADLVRDSLNHVSDTSLPHLLRVRVNLVGGRLDEGHAALDALAARLQAAEQALAEIKSRSSYAQRAVDTELWSIRKLARRALEGAAE